MEECIGGYKELFIVVCPRDCSDRFLCVHMCMCVRVCGCESVHVCKCGVYMYACVCGGECACPYVEKQIST